MADVYRYEWQGVRTGTKYRIDIMKASNSDRPATPDIVTLADNAVDTLSASWQFDPYPYGMPTPIQGKIKFRLKATPRELKEWISAPAVTGYSFDIFNRSWYAGTGAGFSAVAAGITLGTVFEYFVQPPGASNWQRVWVGIQDVGFRVRPDFKTRTLEVVIEDAVRAAGRAVQMDDLHKAWKTYAHWRPSAIMYDTGAHEFLWSTGSSSSNFAAQADKFATWSIGNVVRGDYDEDGALSRFWFTTYFNYCQFIERAWESAFRKLTRQPTAQLNTMTAQIACFDWLRKQTYDRSPVAGAEIGTGSIYVLGWIANDQPATTSSDIAYTVFSELAENYKSVFDYYADVIKNGYRVAHIRYDGTSEDAPDAAVDFWYPLGYCESTGFVDVTEDIRPEFDIQLYEETLQNATASTAYKIEEDIDNRQQVIAYSRGDVTYTIPIVHSTSPVAAKYARTTSRSAVASLFFLRNFKTKGIGSGDWGRTWHWEHGTTSYAYAPRLFGFYYRDNPTGVRDGSSWSFFNEQRMIRAHSWHPIANATETPDKFTPPTPPPSTSPVDPLPDMTTVGSWDALAICLADQRAEGTMSQIAAKFAESFYSTKTAIATGVLRIDTGAIVDTVGDGTEYFAFTPYLRRWQIDANAIDPEEDYYVTPDHYWMTAADTDLKSELSTVKFWGK